MALKNKTHDNNKESIVQRAPRQTTPTSSEHERPLNPVIALKRATGASTASLRPADILALQRAIGNRAVHRMLSNQSRALPVQPSTPAPAIQRKTEEEEPLQGK